VKCKIPDRETETERHSVSVSIFARLAILPGWSTPLMGGPSAHGSVDQPDGSLAALLHRDGGRSEDRSETARLSYDAVASGLIPTERRGRFHLVPRKQWDAIVKNMLRKS
jgi:hypothetical protein